jgi:hypothetical protein
MTGKPGHGKEIARLIQPVPAKNDIAGCEGMDVFVNAHAPDDVLILERWASVKAHQTFLAGIIESGGMGEIAKHTSAITRTYYLETQG